MLVNVAVEAGLGPGSVTGGFVVWGWEGELTERRNYRRAFRDNVQQTMIQLTPRRLQLAEAKARGNRCAPDIRAMVGQRATSGSPRRFFYHGRALPVGIARRPVHHADGDGADRVWCAWLGVSAGSGVCDHGGRGL